jgi:hypothetical protein
MTLPVARVERLEETPEPFGWVAFYCGSELFTRCKSTAEFYADLCKVIPVYTAKPGHQ